MELRKMSPWNWFRKEQEGLPGPSRQGLAPAGRSPSTDPFVSMQRQMQQMMDDMSRQFGMPTLSGFGTSPGISANDRFFRPSVDVKECSDHYNIDVDLPGVSKDDVSVTLEDDALVIRGERQQERESDEENYHFVERHYGSFQRVLDLPVDAVPDSLKAHYQDGVLKLRIDRNEEARNNVKQIEVQ